MLPCVYSSSKLDYLPLLLGLHGIFLYAYLNNHSFGKKIAFYLECDCRYYGCKCSIEYCSKIISIRDHHVESCLLWCGVIYHISYIGSFYPC